jgi:N-acetylmuramoyl-L-alanine amidase
MPFTLNTRLSRLRVAVDVQHLYRTGLHRNDRGSHFHLVDGSSCWEGERSVVYAGAIATWLRERGAAVLTNDPRTGTLCGPYQRRNEEAERWRAHVYLACHLNAGGGRYGAIEYMAAGNGGTLARMMCSTLQEGFKGELQGVKDVPLTDGARGRVCIKWFPLSKPALILEPLFGDTPRHQRLLGVIELGAIAAAMCEGLAIWWEGRVLAGLVP